MHSRTFFPRRFCADEPINIEQQFAEAEIQMARFPPLYASKRPTAIDDHVVRMTPHKS